MLPAGDAEGPAACLRPLAALGVELLEVADLDAVAGQQAPSGAVPGDILALDPASAEAFARRATRSRGGSRLPVLVLADPADPIQAVVAGRALRDSAPWDIVRRDAPPEEILLRAERLVASAQAQLDLDAARYRASHDDRTELLRPSAFDERLREHFSAAQRHHLELALVLVDMDRFGEVNKRYDHTVGDQLISRAGSVIRMSLRAEDVGARIGGDEFALILPYTQRVDAARVVSRLAGRFRALSGPPPAQFRPPADEDEGAPLPVIRVSASLGFETFDGFDIDSPDELRARAERALHEAKARGGDQGVYYRSLQAPDGAEGPHLLRPRPSARGGRGQRDSAGDPGGGREPGADRRGDPAQEPVQPDPMPPR